MTSDPKFLLDTNICIYFRRGRYPALALRLSECAVGSVAISVVTFGELVFGVEKSQNPFKNRTILDRLVADIPVLPLDRRDADHYGAIRQHLASQGQMIGANDLWIAAHARRLEMTLVTNNTREFARVPGLSLEDWTLSPGSS